ncbi:hypothetical protein BHE74_00027149 [Ensete ventricosum]|nr:hypothetical protein BHE74_00027149 [Ensete ventricosum]
MVSISTLDISAPIMNTLSRSGNASTDVDGIMAMGVVWMPFSCSFLRSWAVDRRSSSRKTSSIIVRSMVKYGSSLRCGSAASETIAGLAE